MAENEGKFGASLSERELAVVRGMAKGQSNAEIGRELFISEDTVKTHARRLFRKLGARDRAHAVAQWLRRDGAVADKSPGTSTGDDPSLVKLLGSLPSAGHVNAATIADVYTSLRAVATPMGEVTGKTQGIIQEAGPFGGILVRSFCQQLELMGLLVRLPGNDRRLFIASEQTFQRAVQARYRGLNSRQAHEYTRLVLCLMAGMGGSLMEMAVAHKGLTDRG